MIVIDFTKWLAENKGWHTKLDLKIKVKSVRWCEAARYYNKPPLLMADEVEYCIGEQQSESNWRAYSKDICQALWPQVFEVAPAFAIEQVVQKLSNWVIHAEGEAVEQYQKGKR